MAEGRRGQALWCCWFWNRRENAFGICLFVGGADGLVFVCVVGLVDAGEAAADACPNEVLRVGPSAALPDCRAYELVTPADLGRTQALTFTGDEKAIPDAGGERLALYSLVPLGPNPSVLGSRAVFSRTGDGWEMGSAVTPGASSTRMVMRLFSPDLSQVALESETALNFGEMSPDVTFEAGPVGGPYALIASVPRDEALNTELLGTSADFSHVLFASVDHELPVPEVENASAKTTDSGAYNLYDWSGGGLRLVNAKKDGSPLANLCGATLGAGGGHESKQTTVHAVSEDGSKVFFTSPSPAPRISGLGCEEPSRLFMRVNSDEPIEVSAPEPGVKPTEILPVRYHYATPNGSKVFFNTEMALTSNNSSKENKLFEYETEAPEGKRLKLVASGVPKTHGVGLEELEGLFFGEDGSVVYIESVRGEMQEVARYDTSTGEYAFVALAYQQKGTHEPSYSTPDGEFFLFTSKSLVDPSEPRGTGPQNEDKGPNEMYRYDHADGSVMCVTCGGGDVPAEGELIEAGLGTVLETSDETPAVAQISENGQEVFFQTTAQLVPQDTNNPFTEYGNERGTPGLDVYEWEAEDSEEAPGVFCSGVNGCTHLLSSGEDVGPARLLGASANGRDVFFESASQLVPQATTEFPNIYDARVNGGFAPPPSGLECLSCQGVGSPPPLFNIPASGAFVGAGNTDHAYRGRKTEIEEEKKKKGRKKRPKAESRRRRGRRSKSRVAGYRRGSVRTNREGGA